MEWTEQAACKNELKEMFFCDSLDNKINSYRQIYAKNICRKCPVAAECLMYAIGNKESFGIWGSFAPKERNTILNLFPEDKLDIQTCKKIVNKEIKSIKANLLKREFGI